MYANSFLFNCSWLPTIEDEHGVLVSIKRPSGLDKDTRTGGLEVPSVTLSALVIDIDALFI